MSHALVRKWNSLSIILRIFIGMVIGTALGFLVPSWSGIGILGDIFIGALKAVAPILVCVLVTSSLAQAKTGVGKNFRSVIMLYMVSTFMAAVVAVLGSFLFPVTLTLTGTAAAGTPPSGIAEVLGNLLSGMVENPVKALANANYMGILTWSVLVGLAMQRLASERTKETAADLANSVSKVVGWIIGIAPFGILGLVFRTVSVEGFSAFSEYGRLILILVSCMLLIILVTEPLLVAICLRKNPYPLVFRCVKDSGVTAFFTRSSAANIPVNMALCEKLGLDRNFYSVSIPLGATVNMNGAAVTITVLALAAANTVGCTVDIPTALILSVLATFGACGASGIAGGSLLLVPMACSLFGISNDISMQVVGIGFIIGIIQDSMETAVNSSGDVIFTATAEQMQWKKEEKKTA